MPKSRKKKVKHQDFTKVKLKVGKKLPRAANETDASFKSRTIQLKDQFKADSGEPSAKSSKKKLNITEILSLCQHYNSSSKQDALVSLRELLLVNPEVVHTHLAPIVERCSELFVDKDPQVRSAILRILKVALPKILPNQLAPFFPVLSAHLCCAMTHIYEDIQMDSLNILDIILEHYPELVISSSSQLLPNLLEQISRQSRSSARGVKGKNNSDSRSLVVNPSGKTGSSRWRIGVLRRLSKVLRSVIQVKESHRACGVKHGEDERNIQWGDNQCHMELHSYPGWLTSGFILRNEESSGVVEKDILSDGESFRSYIEMIVPLLLECWVEVGPSQLTSTLPGNSLSADALMTLASVLDVLDLLLKYTYTHMTDDNYLNMTWIQETYQTKFIHYFMSNFPYTMHEQQHRKKNNPDSQQVSMLSLNLAACRVMTYLLDDNSVNQPWLQAMVDFMTEHPQSWKLSPDQLNTAVIIYNKLLHISLHTETKCELLKAVLGVYKALNVKSLYFRTLLKFFAAIFLDDKQSQFKSLDVYTMWVKSFPKAMKELNADNMQTLTLLLTIIKSAVVQGDETFESTLQGYVTLLDKDFVSKLDEKQQCHLVEILFTIRHLRREHFVQLVHLCRTRVLKDRVQHYMLRVLSQRYSKQEIYVGEIGDYLSFMFTTLLGMTSEDLASIDTTPSSTMYKMTIVRDSDTETAWSVHWSQVQASVAQILLQCVLEQLELINLPARTTSEVWQHFIFSLMTNTTTLKLPTVVSILQGSSVLLAPTDHIPQAVISLLSQLVLAVMPTYHQGVSTNQIMAGTHVTDRAETVLQACVQCVSRTPGVWVELLGVAHQMLNTVTVGADGASELLLTVQCLCTSGVMSSVVKAELDVLQAFLHDLKMKYPGQECSIPYSTIVYHITTLST